MHPKFRDAAFAVVLLGAAACALPASAQMQPGYAAGDAPVVAQALRAVAAGNVAAALAARAQAQDPAARKLITWYAHARRDAVGDFAEIAAFARANPHWPTPELLIRTADRSVTAATRADLLLAWFADRLPETGRGLMNAVAALKAQGKAAEAQALLRRGWPRLRLTDAEEAEILQRFGAELRPEDHAARIGYLAGLGQKRLAQQLMARVTLDAPSRAVAEARLLLRDETLRFNPAVVEAALAKVPEAEQAKERFLYDLLRWHRRGNRPVQALAVLNRLPAKLDEPEHWWKELDIAIRQAIQAKQFDAAYQIASRHRQTEGESYADAEFLAGFIALRLLNKPDLAERHFAALEKHPHRGWFFDPARLPYWQARIAEQRGDKGQAQALLARAAQSASTFYGQLAASRLGLGQLKFDQSAAGPPMEKFWGDELVRAAHLLRAAGEGRTARLFALRAAFVSTWNVAQHNYLANFVLALTAPDYREQTAIRMAKLAARDGAPLTAVGFPTLDLPEDNVIEPALVYAIIRQESEFQVGAKSHAGARGLMQLMPFTAKAEATDISMPYVLNRLTADSSYNLRLGTQHMQRLRDYLGGSYPLMIAAYNAGAGRVDRWLSTHGDPRRGKLEWVDWIELIPFDETRLYTKLVLENHTIYRLRLGDKVDLPRLALQWQAPAPDPVTCNTVLGKEHPDYPDVPIEPGATEGTEERPANKGSESKKRPDDIRLVNKPRADNRPGTPGC